MKNRPWIADYKPPAPPDENSNVKKTPEEIEREIKAQEAELQKLLQVENSYILTKFCKNKHTFTPSALTSNFHE